MDYQTGLCEKYLVTGDWSESKLLAAGLSSCFVLSVVLSYLVDPL